MTSHHEGLEVVESGRALKVQTDAPHLVSLGGGRLSTAVTWHPLPQGPSVRGFDRGFETSSFLRCLGWNCFRRCHKFFCASEAKCLYRHVAGRSYCKVYQREIASDSNKTSAGRVTIGAGRDVDIALQGTGVEPLHCHIDNSNGVVTLHPVAEMTAVDGLRVKSATRLTQGCMLCVGRSNYLRFNHPAEARLMKSILPNTRISMVPLILYPGADGSEGFALERKPPVAPRRSPRDSWGDLSTSSSCASGDDCCVLGRVSRFELMAHTQNGRAAPNRLQHFSPKVFPAGCPTASSPASAVLGPARAPSVTNGTRSSPSLGDWLSSRVSRFELMAHTQNGRAAPNRLQHFSPKVFPAGCPTASSPASAVLGPARAPSVTNGTASGSPTLENCSSPTSTPIVVSVRARSATPTHASHLFSNTPPLVNGDFARGLSGVSRSVTSSPAFDRNRSTGSTRSLSPALVRSTDSSSHGSPAGYPSRLATPSPAFNRNPLPYSPGSAFRSVGHRRTLSADSDVRVSFASSNCSSLEELTARNDELEHKRKQAQEARMQEEEGERLERARLEEILNMCAEYERQAQSERQQNKPPLTPTLHQNRIKTNGSLPRDKRLVSPGATAGAPEDEVGEIFTFETSSTSVIGPYENVVIPAACAVVHPQSPRTRIRTIAPSAKDASEVIENRLAVSSDYEFVGSLPRSRTTQEMPGSAVSSTAVSNKSQTNDKGKFILPLEKERPEEHLNDRIDAVVISNKQAVSAPRKVNGEVRDVARDQEGKIQGDKVTRKEERGLDVGMSNEAAPEQKCGASQPEMKIEADRQNTSCGDVEQLRRERGKLLATMSGLKRKVADIEQQEEELLRELDMERALLEGEWQAQSEKLLQEEERLSVLRERVARLDEEMERRHARELRRQAEVKRRLEATEREIHSLEQEAAKCASSGNGERDRELTEALRQQHELLEAEKKAFEDLEFRQLEEEAGWLAGREELQRELVDMAARVETRGLRLRELEQQRLEIAQSAQEESRATERQLLDCLRRLEEVRRFLPMTLDVRSDRKQSSQDDLDRISRVTSGAPIEMGGGSLGRRTLESLQEIERNRQRHLAQQGSQVIEDERKRVQELKRQRVVHKDRTEIFRRINSAFIFDRRIEFANKNSPPYEFSPSIQYLRGAASFPCFPPPPPPTSLAVSESLNHKRVKSRVSLPPLPQMRTTHALVSISAIFKLVLFVIKQEAHQRPLTRYLPIRSESLNLRQHIESAGHQIELCPHASLDSTSCRGYLHKMGSKFHHWNRRWFVFDRVRRTFTYYSDRGEKKPRGGAYFQSIEEVYVDHLNSVKSPNPQLTFVVKTNERMYHLMAPSPEAMRIWVDVIFTGAEGYQEFEHGS
ncbi:hypothetical protein L798_03213 [Zootermopsis nevadensis]|uniref:PH domain-containing protein n=1 Tax=Zootermopsis nevadensis TaxID=136037 RepID=A0A067QIX4_ZOONE|nr:hypothetical protein L798_03213 [Zootermopsis nevadensis]